MTVNIELTMDELKLVKKAMADLSYNTYLGKVSKSYRDMGKPIDALYDKIADLYNGFKEEKHD